MPKAMSNRNESSLLENLIINLIEIPKILWTLYIMGLFLLKVEQPISMFPMSSHEYIISDSIDNINSFKEDKYTY